MLINNKTENFVVVVPAAGVGKRMKAQCPKQYLMLLGKTLIEHTVERLLSHPRIAQVIIVLGEKDEYFPSLALANYPQVSAIIGGVERVDSVLAGLKSIDLNRYSWVLVHDAARPCLRLEDIDNLIAHCMKHHIGGLLATPVRDTMKRTQKKLELGDLNKVDYTEQRNDLWHALTPQMYPVEQLTQAIESALAKKANITDESSAIEFAQLPSAIVEGRSDNIKVTQQDDLALAEFILKHQQVELTSCYKNTLDKE